MSKPTAHRVRLNASDDCPPLSPSACNQYVVIHVTDGSALVFSRGTAARLGAELLHKAMLDAYAHDITTLQELEWRLDFLREMVDRINFEERVLQ